MDFFGIGPLELLLILIILMVVMGPEKIPDLARRLGRAVRAFRGVTTNITQEIEREVRAIDEDVRGGGEGGPERAKGEAVPRAEGQRETPKG